MKRCFLLGAGIALLISLATGEAQQPSRPAGTLDIEKVAIPNADQLKAAKKAVRDLFAAEYKAAKSPQQKIALAGTLAQKANESKGDPDSEYALGMEATELYVACGDAFSAFRAIDELALTFAVPVVSTKLTLFKRASKEAKTPPQKRLAALVGLKLASDAVADEAYDSAKEAATLALALARPSRDQSAIQRAIDQQAKITEALKFWSEVEDARKKLKTDPADPGANEIVGRYLCFVRQNWKEGLLSLSKASDQELRFVAGLDLAPSGDDAFKSIGDAWWDVAEHRKKERNLILPRCAFWYEKALPGLTGLPRANVEKRLQEAYEAMSGRNFAKILAEAANGVRSQGVVDCAAGMVPAQMNPAFDIRKSWVLSLQFNAPNLDGGAHVIFGWADGRGGRDPIVVVFNSSILGCYVDDCLGDRRQGINLTMPPSIISKWVDVKFVHDSVSQELELYIDNRLIQKDPLTIPPTIDRAMPVCLGGIEGSGMRFVGQVRNVWLGNIK